MRSRSRRLPLGELCRRPELQLSIFVQDGDRFDGRPLHHEIIDRARRAGLRGATAVRGMQGFGASGKLRASGLAGLSGHEPVLIQVTDDAARVRAFVTEIERLPGTGLILLQPVVTLCRVAEARDVAASVPT